jgi:hypothetical protein
LRLPSALAVLALITYASAVQALEAGFNTTVISTMVDHDRFNGCLIKVDRVPDQLSCRQNEDGIAWVVAECDTEQGRDSFKQAQLALLTTGKLAIWVSDSSTTEGFCNVYRTIYSG